MLTAKDNELYYKLQRRGMELDLDDVATLRRAELALHRWAERECGDDHGCIERDESTDLPFWLDSRTMERTRISDREAGALKRINKVCALNGLGFYHQTDPRGCALYVSREQLTASNYTDGVACSI